MKKYLVIAALPLLAACAPTASQLKKVVEENPDIVFSAIEKNPAKFFEVVRAAQGKAQEAEMAKMREQETKEREEEMKNPKVAEIDDKRAIQGKKDAKITIVEYSDFQCPFCKRGHMTMEQLLKDYPDKVRVVFKNMPIDRLHPNARIAHKYYEAIALQDIEKAAKFKHEVFTNQEDLGEKGEGFLKEVVKKIGVNAAKVAKDISSPEVAERISKDQAEAEKFGFNGTPGYLVNGVSIRGAEPIENFKELIDKLLAKN